MITRANTGSSKGKDLSKFDFAKILNQERVLAKGTVEPSAAT